MNGYQKGLTSLEWTYLKRRLNKTETKTIDEPKKAFA